MRIAAKVAEVLSDLEVALNVGAAAGVKVDDAVTIYRVRRITDPDTREALGSVRTPVVAMRITLVEDQLSIARSIETIRAEPNTEPATGLARWDWLVATGPAWVTKQITDDAARADERTQLVQRGWPAEVESDEAPAPPGRRRRRPAK